MKRSEGPGPRVTIRESAVARVVEALVADPGQWYDVTDEFGKGATTGSASSMYRYAGREFTPLEVVIHDGQLHARWGTDRRKGTTRSDPYRDVPCVLCHEKQDHEWHQGGGAPPTYHDFEPAF